MSFQPVAMGSAQLSSLQLTMATLALRMAIRQVEQAVERVEEAVNEVRLLLETERSGAVIGVYRALQEPATRLRSTASPSATDWSIVGPLHAEVLGQVAMLRGYVEGSLKDGEDAGSVHARLHSAEKLGEGRGVKTALALLLVAEESLSLWQELRLAHVAATEPDSLESVAASAHQELNARYQADTRLVEQLGVAIRRLTDARPTEGLLPWTHDELDDARHHLVELQAWFADQRGIQRQATEDVTRPGVIDGTKAAGSLIAGASRTTARVVAVGSRRVRDRVRRRKSAGSGFGDKLLPVTDVHHK